MTLKDEDGWHSYQCKGPEAGRCWGWFGGKEACVAGPAFAERRRGGEEAGRGTTPDHARPCGPVEDFGMGRF